ncbi:lipopolysaccharide assembly protein b [Anaeramoeba flamelloides]|uniref:Lipopolysaccharide assembly protein b n=1 Tax=Anaeramoeba flamelloides TaxID=1746091 RepID=A0AAV8A8C3_9EUKA|nr:lipopolysaccharide assembly protein b [Anaeramoeba flamelloides]
MLLRDLFLVFFCFLVFLPQANLEIFQKQNTKDKSKLQNSYQYQVQSSDSEITSSSTFYRKGNQFLIQGDFSTAITWFLRTISLMPNHLESHFKLGSLYYLIQDYPSSLHFFEKTLEIDKSFSLGYLWVGHLNWVLGDTRKAKRNYQLTINLDPENYEAHRYLALCYLDKMDYKNSDEQFYSLSQSDPYKSLVYPWYAFLKYTQNDYYNSLLFLKSSYKLHPLYNQIKSKIISQIACKHFILDNIFFFVILFFVLVPSF